MIYDRDHLTDAFVEALADQGKTESGAKADAVLVWLDASAEDDVRVCDVIRVGFLRVVEHLTFEESSAASRGVRTIADDVPFPTDRPIVFFLANEIFDEGGDLRDAEIDRVIIKLGRFYKVQLLDDGDPVHVEPGDPGYQAPEPGDRRYSGSEPATAADQAGTSIARDRFQVIRRPEGAAGQAIPGSGRYVVVDFRAVNPTVAARFPLSSDDKKAAYAYVARRAAELDRVVAKARQAGGRAAGGEGGEPE